MTEAHSENLFYHSAFVDTRGSYSSQGRSSAHRLNAWDAIRIPVASRPARIKFFNHRERREDSV